MRKFKYLLFCIIFMFGTISLSQAQDKSAAIEEALDSVENSQKHPVKEESEVKDVPTTEIFFNDVIDTISIEIKHTEIEPLVAHLEEFKSEKGKIITSENSAVLVLMDYPNRLDQMEDYIKVVDIAVETRTFQLRHSQVDEFKDALGEIMTKDVGTMQLDDQLNQITVKDSVAKLEKIAQIIVDADIKIEIMFDSHIVGVSLSEEHQQGIDWEAIVSDYQKNDVLSIGTVTNEDYSVLIEALETIGIVSTLASSQAKTGVNEEVKIVLAPLTQEGQVKQTGKSDMEISMRVTPQLQKKEELININFHPEMSWTIENILAEHQDHLSRQSLSETKVSIKKDEIIVIGGLMSEKEVSKTSKVPLLGDIPFLGIAFRHKDKLMEKTEYIVFLTPKVVYGD